MVIALPAPLIEKLSKLPETGMGFQVVDLAFADGRTITGVQVVNAEFATVPDLDRPLDAAEIVDATLSARRGT